eukprot:GHVS01092187.1.p2 GENE.GHVS01092187.1~~GHVS01092187.1.p2  ORF type:complete len:169 (+),score=9.77 GHVS01092187.1:577-1083(+)
MMTKLLLIKAECHVGYQSPRSGHLSPSGLHPPQPTLYKVPGFPPPPPRFIPGSPFLSQFTNVQQSGHTTVSGSQAFGKSSLFTPYQPASQVAPREHVPHHQVSHSNGTTTTSGLLTLNLPKPPPTVSGNPVTGRVPSDISAPGQSQGSRPPLKSRLPPIPGTKVYSSR